MNHIFKHLLLLGVMIVAPLVPSMARADIYCSSPDTHTIVASQAIVVDNGDPNGTIVGTATGYMPESVGYGCSGMGTAVRFYGAGAPVPGYDSTYYQTGIPGLAYRIYVTGGCASGYYPLSCPYKSTYAPGFKARDFTIEFVKVGAVLEGRTLSGEFARVDNYGSGGYFTSPGAIFYWSSDIQVTVANPTCTVTTPSIAVPLPATSITAFGLPGTTAGALQNFNINLNCSGGDPGTSTRMYITLTDSTNPGNTTDMLSPTAATAGTGVGVRIFNGSTPVKYGPASDVVGNINQWQVTTVNPGSSTVSIPLAATYVQVGPTVRAGPVSAIATFTMAYN